MHRLPEDLVPLLPRLRRFAWSLTRNWADADDLTQSACLKALDHRADWPEGEALDRWMYRLTRNLWIDETRKRSLRQGAGQEEAETSTALLAPGSAETSAYAGQVLRALAALPEGFGTALLLVAVEGHSYQDTAEIMDIPVGTVMSRLATARTKLRAQLADRQEVPQ